MLSSHKGGKADPAEIAIIKYERFLLHVGHAFVVLISANLVNGFATQRLDWR